jgi:hypothetical protein
MAAGFVFVLRDYLKGWKHIVIPVIVSSSYVMANAGLGWPGWVALSADNGYQTTFGAGIATFSLIITTVWIISLVVPDASGSFQKKKEWTSQSIEAHSSVNSCEPRAGGSRS